MNSVLAGKSVIEGGRIFFMGVIVADEIKDQSWLYHPRGAVGFKYPSARVVRCIGHHHAPVEAPALRAQHMAGAVAADQAWQRAALPAHDMVGDRDGHRAGRATGVADFLIAARLVAVRCSFGALAPESVHRLRVRQAVDVDAALPCAARRVVIRIRLDLTERVLFSGREAPLVVIVHFRDHARLHRAAGRIVPLLRDLVDQAGLVAGAAIGGGQFQQCLAALARFGLHQTLGVIHIAGRARHRRHTARFWFRWGCTSLHSRNFLRSN